MPHDPCDCTQTMTLIEKQKSKKWQISKRMNRNDSSNWEKIKIKIEKKKRNEHWAACKRYDI